MIDTTQTDPPRDGGTWLTIRQAREVLPPRIAQVVATELDAADQFGWLRTRGWHLGLAQEIRELHRRAAERADLGSTQVVASVLTSLELRSGRGPRVDAERLITALASRGLTITAAQEEVAAA